MKRGLFVFEPAMVIVFLVAILAATTVILHAKSLALSAAWGGDAQLITGAYLIGENQVGIPRMLNASYAITNAVYLLAAGAGMQRVYTPGFKPGCQWLWQASAPGGFTIREPEIPELDQAADAFKQILSKELATAVPYRFSIAEPFTVTGVPLQPEQIPIDTIPSSGLTGPAGFRNERLGFTIERAYPFAAMYQTLKEGVAAIRLCGAAGTTEGPARALCLDDAVKKLNAEPSRLISWTITPRRAGQYYVDAVQEYQFPYCLNKPSTLIWLVFPK